MRDVPSPWPGTIREINDLPRPDKLAIYETLIPEWVFPHVGIDPGQDIKETRVIQVRCPSGSNSVEISAYHALGARDPVLYLQMGDTFNSQLVVLLVIVNDPNSPRFDIDVDEHGNSTQLGTAGRNIPEELRAMQAGLGPGQVRRGMRIFRSGLPVFDDFVTCMGHDLYFIEPLFYHNAITSERYGFAYARGLQKMRAINDAFLPGGQLHAKLPGESPFRPPDAWRTVLGRSWAIHDGILGEPFTGVQMYKRAHRAASVDTFPHARWC
jgi:hypothetical protein